MTSRTFGRTAGGGLALVVCAVVLAFMASLASPPRAHAQPAASGAAGDALAKGDYDAAIAAARRTIAADPRNAVVARLLVRANLATGRYDAAVQAARDFTAANPRSPELWNRLGDALRAKGGDASRAAAEEAYLRSLALRASDALAAEASLAEMRADRGLATEAAAGFERLITAYNSGRARTASDLIAVGRASRRLGATNPDSFRDALKAFDEAAAAPSNEIEDLRDEAAVLSGDLFLEKFNGADARAAFEAVLGRNPRHAGALHGLARALDFDGERGVPDLLAKALDVNPFHADARATFASLLLALEDFGKARAEAETAVRSQPDSLDALSALAAVHFIGGDTAGYAGAKSRALALYPENAGLFVAVAEAAVRNRLYAEALDLADQGLAVDPRSWAAHAMRGQNLLRLGRIDAGRASLDRAFAGDPFNVWVKNTLDLLDTFPKYRTTRHGRFDLFLDARESDALAPILGRLADEAMAALGARYGFVPKDTIRIEAFPSHADFSVRTIGLAGLGALGVCFGPVVVIDSPAARDRGSFNWGSTLWHELAHVATMGASKNRVPRWLTEGISVVEERRARRGWGDDLSVDFLLAYKDGELLDLKELNNGFIRPARPEQVGLSYYQASLVVEHLEGAFGSAAIRGLLGAYGEGLSTDAAFQRVLGTSVEAVDAAFKAGLKARLDGPASLMKRPGRRGLSAPPPTRGDLERRVEADPKDFLAQTSLGHAFVRERRNDDALRHLEKAAELWPHSAGPESPYPAIARIRRDRKDPKGAIEALRTYVALNENDEESRLLLATLLEDAGDAKGALATLDETLYIYPFESKTHERRAALAAQLKDAARALDARRALVALDPVDRAEAYYQLAVAEMDAGDSGSARRSVLRALEAAPRFVRAQELLLKLHRAAGEKK